MLQPCETPSEWGVVLLKGSWGCGRGLTAAVGERMEGVCCCKELAGGN